MTSNPTSEAGMYSHAHAALDDLARERIAAADAKVSQLEALVTALSAQLEGAKEALRPFAKFYNDLDGLQLITGGRMPHDSKCIATVTHAGVGARIELGSFRLAASTLYGLEKINVSSVSQGAAQGTTALLPPSAEPSAVKEVRAMWCGFFHGEPLPGTFSPTANSAWGKLKSHPKQTPQNLRDIGHDVKRVAVAWKL